ncbi:MAG: hypothetical protein ABIF19_14415 [Planctomycetota bacterium]
MSESAVNSVARRMVTCPWLLALVVVGLHPGLVESPLGAGPPRALLPGELPADTRLGPLRGERGDFSFVPARSRQEWERRAEYLRRVMRVTLGLWPMPTGSPLNPVIHGLIDQGDYMIEKVYFESIPGFYVTGISTSDLKNRLSSTRTTGSHARNCPCGMINTLSPRAVPISKSDFSNG